MPDEIQWATRDLTCVFLTNLKHRFEMCCVTSTLSFKEITSKLENISIIFYIDYIWKRAHAVKVYY